MQKEYGRYITKNKAYWEKYKITDRGIVGLHHDALNMAETLFAEQPFRTERDEDGAVTVFYNDVVLIRVARDPVRPWLYDTWKFKNRRCTTVVGREGKVVGSTLYLLRRETLKNQPESVESGGLLMPL